MNKIINTAFIIPTYPRHYFDLYKFIEPIYDIIDIYIVFTNIEEYYMFREKDKIKAIIIDQPIITKCIVTFKKFYGLKHLINSSYDYFIVCDSESKIVLENFTSFNVNNKINEIFNNKIVYGEKMNDEFLINIMKISSNVFSIEQQEILKKETDNYTIYTWWSDLPVYKKEHLNDFFNKFNYENIVTEHFDYIIYQYYLILNYNFRLINTDTTIITLYPSFTTIEDEINQLNRLKFGFSFINGPLYERHVNYFKEKGTFLVGNLDR